MKLKLAMTRHLLLIILGLVFIQHIVVWADNINNTEYLTIQSGDTLSEIAYRKKVELQLNENLQHIIQKFLTHNSQIKNPDLIITADLLKNPYYTANIAEKTDDKKKLRINQNDQLTETETKIDLPYQYKIAAGYYFAKHTTKFGQSQISLASDYWLQLSTSIIIPWNEKFQSEIKLTFNHLKYLTPLSIVLDKNNSHLLDLEFKTSYELNNYLSLGMALINRQKNFLSNLGSSQFNLNKENIQTMQASLVFAINNFYVNLNQSFLIGSSDINFRINSFQSTEIAIGHKNSKNLGIELTLESAYAKTHLNSTTENLLGAKIYRVF